MIMQAVFFRVPGKSIAVYIQVTRILRRDINKSMGRRVGEYNSRNTLKYHLLRQRYREV